MVNRLRDTIQDENVHIVDDTDQLITDCKQGKIDAVYITLAMLIEHLIKQIAEKLADSTASVYPAPDLFIFKGKYIVCPALAEG
ncbi:MAG: hypothetical protein HRT92_06820 [Piscirickettsiaceae bacterium]|nr:hypothetical protein [Piscirickettsiaceae bacterium]